MAANIREVSDNKPGGRVLVIVGAAHKPWLDAYLSMMSDVAIADAQQVLR
jgi:pheromone shutdown protein TraB